MSDDVCFNSMSVLSNCQSSLAQILQAIAQMEKAREYDVELSVGLSSNVTVELLGTLLKKHSLLHGIKLNIVLGNYDDPVGDLDLFAQNKVDYVLLLPFFDNLLPSFESQITRLPQEIIAAKNSELHSKYHLAFKKAHNFKQVFVGAFHRYNYPIDSNDAVQETIARYNKMLFDEGQAFSNICIVDLEQIVSRIGQLSAFDHRFYFRNKAPYTKSFYNILAQQVLSRTRGFGSFFYKILVVDCDNTLWGGVIGEDLIGGIKLNPYDYPGNVFWRIQQEIASLEQKGILLCICSKNNVNDVDEVLNNHPDAVLRGSNFIIKKINWNDKSENLLEIAQELNVGLESIIFLDDSSFECEAIRNKLPNVRTFQVPSNLSEYPLVMQEIKELFLAGGISDGSSSKTEQYRHLFQAEQLKEQSQSNEEYLASLGLRVTISINDAANIPRISELSLKSNQFNLTTRRYTESEIKKLMHDETVFSIGVCDKFGNAGLTGVLIIKWRDSVAVIDSFLMSCRVIGRGIELSFWNEIREHVVAKGCKTLYAEFLPTAKNSQVTDFYERLGMSLIEKNDEIKRYQIELDTFEPKPVSWIEVTYVK